MISKIFCITVNGLEKVKKQLSIVGDVSLKDMKLGDLGVYGNVTMGGMLTMLGDLQVGGKPKRKK